MRRGHDQRRRSRIGTAGARRVVDPAVNDCGEHAAVRHLCWCFLGVNMLNNGLWKHECLNSNRLTTNSTLRVEGPKPMSQTLSRHKNLWMYAPTYCSATLLDMSVYTLEGEHG